MTRRGEATAQRLLDAALEVHGDAGHAGLTVQAVLDRSGVSLGSLYHHFGSANGLAAALYERCLSRMLDAVLAELDRARTARTGVRAVVVGYLRFTREHPAEARYVHASSYATFLPEFGGQIARATGDRTARLHDWFRPHVAAGRVVDLPLDVLEVLLIGPPAELARRWLAGHPGLDPHTAERTLPEQIWRSVQAR